ncbi:MAG: hypothetical protein ACT4O1_08810 [Gemmatimonadota bacterium]
MIVHRVVAALGLAMLVACGPSDEERALRAAADSMAAARARGETDLSNPEMGAKMSVTLNDSALEQSHTEIPKGQVTVVVQNQSSAPRIFELKGSNANFRSLPIPAGGYVLMSVIIDQSGDYHLTCPDSAAARSICGTGKLTAK